MPKGAESLLVVVLATGAESGSIIVVVACCSRITARRCHQGRIWTDYYLLLNMPTETNFDKLTDGNFHEWKIYMEALLTRKGLLDYVNGTERHPRGTEGSKKVKEFYHKQSEARAKIILHVTPSQLAHCHDMDPMIIWNNLITIHSSHGHSTIIALCCCFHPLVVTTFIIKIRQMPVGHRVQCLEL